MSKNYPIVDQSLNQKLNELNLLGLIKNFLTVDQIFFQKLNGLNSWEIFLSEKKVYSNGDENYIHWKLVSLSKESIESIV